MVGCWAFVCTNWSGTGLSFFSFPKDDRRRKEWATKVNRVDSSDRKHVKLLQPSITSKLCEVSRTFYLFSCVHLIYLTLGTPLTDVTVTFAVFLCFWLSNTHSTG